MAGVWNIQVNIKYENNDYHVKKLIMITKPTWNGSELEINETKNSVVFAVTVKASNQYCTPYQSTLRDLG